VSIPEVSNARSTARYVVETVDLAGTKSDKSGLKILTP